MKREKHYLTNSGKTPTVKEGDSITYTITVYNAENNNYNASESSANFTVFKAGSSVSVNVDNVTYNASVVVKVTVENATTVAYTLKYANGTVIKENVTIADLTNDLTFALDAGDYTITVYNAENGNYNVKFVLKGKETKDLIDNNINVNGSIEMRNQVVPAPGELEPHAAWCEVGGYNNMIVGTG